ncbi:MAG: zincin-like metallopeptidase domain-containing protein [Clostridia bacterium]|nr:zincin-like metallopeptidase domain-containing protein [Clostridia bacterium]
MPTAKEIVNESRKELVKEIIENMKKGFLFSQDRWDKEAIRPHNPISKAKYQGVNRMRLAYQAIKKGYKDPRWVTFLQAKENGWEINSKEKGTLCEKWIWTKEIKELDEDKKEVKKIIQLKVPIVNYFTLFNATQITGMPEYNKKEKNDTELFELANDLINCSECPINEIAQEKCFYSPIKDEIILTPRRYFKSEEAFIATLLHEMSHSTGHESRLNRNIINVFGTNEYAKEELRAELGAIFVEADLNFDLKGENKIDHTNYLKSWISVLEDNPDELFKACNDSSKILERIIENYNNYIELEKNNKQEMEDCVFEM